jgi:hypothetical protein
MGDLLRSIARLGRVRLALVISVLLNILLGVIADIAYSTASSSRISRLFDRLGAPAEALTNWLVPGHTVVQPVADMFFSVTFCWAVMWISLSVAALWSRRE